MTCCDYPGCDYDFGEPAPAPREVQGRWYVSNSGRDHRIVWAHRYGVNGTEVKTRCGRRFTIWAGAIVDEPNRPCRVCAA